MKQAEQGMAKKVYDSLWGSLKEEYRVPWVENAAETGSYCMNKYGEMLGAYWRLARRANGTDEDGDGEIMINSLLDIQEYLCLKMFEYGVLYAKKYCCE